MGIIPDKFIMLSQEDDAIYAKLFSDMSQEAKHLQVHDEKKRAQLARNALLEYKLNIEGVQKICQGMITTMQAQQDYMPLVEQLVRNLKIKDTNAPRRPQRIFLLGSPGSNKEQYAQRIAEKYKLVYVQVPQLIKETMRRNADNDFARQLKSYIAQDRVSKYMEANLMDFFD